MNMKHREILQCINIVREGMKGKDRNMLNVRGKLSSSYFIRMISGKHDGHLGLKLVTHRAGFNVYVKKKKKKGDRTNRENFHFSV